MITLVDNFYNKVSSALDAKYFPNVKFYRDNEKCAKLHYQTELFNNGCLSYEMYIKRVGKLCKDSDVNISMITDKYIETHEK